MTARPDAVAILAADLSVELQDLALRYVNNALASPARRTLRLGNTYVSQLTSHPAGELLLLAAGFEQRGDQLVLAGDGTEEALRPLGIVTAALVAQVEARRSRAPNLVQLPDDLLLRCLTGLAAEDLSCFQRCSQAARCAAQEAQLPWLRLCASSGLRQGIRLLGAAQQAELPPARVICRLERAWTLLEHRAGQQARCTLRPGLDVPSAAALLRRAPALRGLPSQLVASLLVHDGQNAGAEAEGIGLLFDGARLLCAAEIVREAAERPLEEGLLPLTSLQGFKQLACRADGSILLLSGFNAHVKARSWALFLERLLLDTL